MLQRSLLIVSAVVALLLPVAPALAVPNPNAESTPEPADAGARVTRDPAEYNAYITALSLTDPVQKAAAMEAFVVNYPNSSIKVDALEQAMSAYQHAGNTPKVENVANRLLAIDRGNVRALAILTYIKRTEAAQGSAEALAAVQTDANRGLSALPSWAKPQGMSAGDFGKLHDQMSVIFEGALGFAAFTNKDYPAARDHYLKSVRIDAGNLQDLYQLGLSQLQLTPIDVSGFWYLARAWNLAAKNAAAQQTIATYAKAKYVNYHGGADGWDAILENARTNSAPPTDFAVTSAH